MTMMTPPAVTTTCLCGAQIAPGVLACPGCARLVHAAALTQLANDAERAERDGDRTAALAAWRKALELLPQGTAQRSTIEARMQSISASFHGTAPAKSGSNTGAAAGIGAAGLALLKSKALLATLGGNAKLLLLGLTKLPTLLSMLVYAGFYTRNMGVGIGIVASIYVHEIGHVAALKRYGIESSPPMFVPGFGAFVRMKQYPTDAHEEARTGLAGPLWGLGAALIARAIGILAASSTARTVASYGAMINLFNLIPVWQLDGARGLRALSRSERIFIAVSAGALAVALSQFLPAAIAVATLFQLKTAHPKGDRGAFALFAALMVALSLLAS